MCRFARQIGWRDVFDAAHPDVECGVPGGAELLRLGVAAQQVGTHFGAADVARGGFDAAGLGQRLDKRELHLRLPAVVAVLFARDGGEGREDGLGRGVVGAVGHGGEGSAVGRGNRPACREGSV